MRLLTSLLLATTLLAVPFATLADDMDGQMRPDHPHQLAWRIHAKVADAPPGDEDMTYAGPTYPTEEVCKAAIASPNDALQKGIKSLTDYLKKAQGHADFELYCGH